MSNAKDTAKSVTQADIARALRISQYAVSLALRNSPMISVARRKLVHETAQAMGYRPNPAASTLASSRGAANRADQFRESLAWLNFWPDPKQLRRWGEFDCYWRGAKACAEKAGYRLEEFVCAGMTLKRAEQQLRARGVQGILLPPHGSLQLDLSRFGWEHFAVVRFGTTLAEPAAHSVGADSVANVIRAFTAIRARGYRRVGFVGYPAGSRLTLHAFLGCQHQIPAKERLAPFCMSGEAALLPRYQGPFTEWLRQNQPDAILAEVVHVAGMLAQARVRIPKDLALAGTTVLDVPQITAGIDQNSTEIGRVAVLTLISILRDHDRGIPTIHREVLIKGKWIDGPSLPTRNRTAKRSHQPA